MQHPSAEVLQTAKALIDQHGPLALKHAESRADASLHTGDVHGWMAWERIWEAVGNLLNANTCKRKFVQ